MPNAITGPITAILREYDGEQPGSRFQKDFESEALMYAWLRAQSGHPFLSFRIESVEARAPEPPKTAQANDEAS